VNGVAQKFIARPTDLGLVDLTGLKAHRRGSRVTLPDVMGAVALGIAANGG
jgi:hypothetical protein